MAFRSFDLAKIELAATEMTWKPKVVTSRFKRWEYEARAKERREQYRRENGR